METCNEQYRRNHTRWVQDWYKKHPEAYKKSGRHKPGYENRQYAKKRMALIELFGGKCSRCGNDDYRVLQLNHINGGGRKDMRNYSSPYAFYKAILSEKRAREDLNLLCGNCNILYEYECGRKRAVHPLRMTAIRLLGGKCNACGISDPRILHINHVNGRMKGESADSKAEYEFYRSIISGSRRDVNLLCANCNVLYEYERGTRRELEETVMRKEEHHDIP